MCVSRYLLYVGHALVPMAVICIVSNILLLFPEMTYHFLLDGHVTREATWATGLWASGFLVLLGADAFLKRSRTRGFIAARTQMFGLVMYSCLGLLAASVCCVVSATGLVQGPLCLYNSSSGLTWGVPLKPVPDSHAGYLYNQSMWSGICLKPKSVVEWNVVLFSMMGLCSAAQAVLCGLNILNSLAGLVVGQGIRPRPARSGF
ncbi:transmembrane 4 L6 family member 5-like [Poeciliopsis prolifica]|uniref:transmembrane 4 L6 family member 5-like n=1 Tax=Poeciliopsis prolifica TaxID=188132 RepID=UPI00241309F4|nr:transmembrane 4 L6 family member 5-like [Poeciliopsis prolifica]